MGEYYGAWWDGHDLAVCGLVAGHEGGEAGEVHAEKEQGDAAAFKESDVNFAEDAAAGEVTSGEFLVRAPVGDVNLAAAVEGERAYGAGQFVLEKVSEEAVEGFWELDADARSEATAGVF